MKKHFRKIAKIALVLVYLVIIAGAIVRMSGSGMGCPDWPKCFGYYIPPTKASEIEFKTNHNYKKGVIIIHNEALLVAKKDFTSNKILKNSNWETYTKHDYATYDATHTWIEYINRLIGVLSGIPILIFTIVSFWFWKKNKLITIVSILTIFGMAFQAWLGKTVVDSNLAPYKITVHMVMALIIVAFILYLIYASKVSFKAFKFDSKFNNILKITIVLSLIQIILGTQVRQFVDEQTKLIGSISLEDIKAMPLSFYIHRTFSIIVLLLNGFLFFRNLKLKLGYKKINLVMLCILFEIFTGIAMYYFKFPFLSQPIHLVIASIMIGIQFYVYLESTQPKKLNLQ